jgi:hypothetical protein
MNPPEEEHGSLEELLAAARPAQVPGLGERSVAAVGDRGFARKIAWLDAGDAARVALRVAVPLLVVATLLAIWSLTTRRPTAEPTRTERPFGPSLGGAGFLGKELE